ncbi:MAG: hypothetical protein KTV16_15860 [Acidimicrobiia bacterium]|nr:hypothetical protein [Acidimicrobiia bacterium]
MTVSYHHFCAIRINDALYCWGSDKFGQLAVP